VSVDPRAASGFASVAEAYERGRPSYPVEAIERVLADLALTDASRVLDLAAGTGQLSRLLHTRVGAVVAVEPVQAMRTKLAATMPDVTVLDGTAEAIPLGDRDVHAVVVGEAFHWFQTAAATKEIARVLTDGGGIALLWNSPTWTLDDTPWLAAFRRIVAHHRQAAGSYPAGDGTWRIAFERTRLFQALEHVQVAHAQVLDPVGFVAQVASWSWIANLGSDQRQVILDDVHALVEGHDEIVIPYRTDLHLARRRGHAE